MQPKLKCNTLSAHQQCPLELSRCLGRACSYYTSGKCDIPDRNDGHEQAGQAPKPTERLRRYTLDDLTDSEARSLPLLGCDGYLFEGWSHIISSDPKGGKTELLVNCLPEWLKDHIVLYLSEEPEGMWKLRRKKGTLNVDSERMSRLQLYGALGAGRVEVHKAIHDSDADIVVIDTFLNVLTPEDINSNADIAKELSPVIEQCRKLGKTLIVLVHERKDATGGLRSVAGGYDFTALVDVVLQLRKEPKPPTRRTISGAGRIYDIEELSYERRGDDLVVVGTKGEMSKEKVREKALSVLSDEFLSADQILEKVQDGKFGKDQLVKVLNELAREGTLERDPPINSERQTRGVTHRWRKLKNGEDGQFSSDGRYYNASELNFEERKDNAGQFSSDTINNRASELNSKESTQVHEPESQESKDSGTEREKPSDSQTTISYAFSSSESAKTERERLEEALRWVYRNRFQFIDKDKLAPAKANKYCQQLKRGEDKEAEAARFLASLGVYGEHTGGDGHGAHQSENSKAECVSDSQLGGNAHRGNGHGQRLADDIRKAQTEGIGIWS